MDLNELVPAPSSKKIAQVANKIFGYAIDVDGLTESKAKKLHKNVSETLQVMESREGASAFSNRQFQELRIAKQALEAKMAEEPNEDNAFNSAAAAAKKAGKSHFTFNGKKYPVKMDKETADGLSEGFAVGANVAPAEEGPDQAPGKVIAVDGDKVTVKFMDGSTEVFAQDELFALPTGLKMGEGVTEGRMSMRQLASMDKDAARKIEAMVGPESKYADMGDYQEALYNAAKRMGLVESVQINEGEVENAELVLAAKDMVDRVQGMLEDIGKMINEDLPPLTDAIRDEMDSTVADSFNSSMSTALNSLLDNLGTARTGVDEASRVLVGDTPAEPMGAEEPGEVTAPDAEPEDDFGASDPAVGGEEPMGRELAGGEEEETDVFGEPA